MTVASGTGFSILGVLAALSNLAVMCIVIRRPHMRTVSNLLLVCLTLTQLLMTVTVVPFSIATFLKQSWSFGDEFCQFQGYMAILLSISSATFISIMSVDRFFSLANPMSHAVNVTEKHVLLASILNWLLSAFWASLPLLGIKDFKYSYKPERKGCGFRWDLKGSFHIYYYFIAMESFIIPSFIMCLMHFKSFQTARQSARQVRPCNIQIQTLQNGDFTSVAVTKNKHSVKANCTLTLIIGSFVITRGPHTIVNIVTSLTREGYFSPLTEAAVTFLLYLGPLFDPLVYLLLNRKLRHELFLIFRTCFRKRQEDEEPKDIVDYLRSIADQHENRQSSTEIVTHDIE